MTPQTPVASTARSPSAATNFLKNLHTFLWVFGLSNVVLCLFNLLPVPPLDGSHILANFHRGYGRFINDPTKHGVMLFMFIIVFMLADLLFAAAASVCDGYLLLIDSFRGLLS